MTLNGVPLPESAVELLEGELWVDSEDDDGILKFTFYSFVSSNGDGTSVEADILMTGTGVLGLRECRHTYWGENGYIYYINRVHIEKIMEWLSDRFDLI